MTFAVEAGKAHAKRIRPILPSFTLIVENFPHGVWGLLRTFSKGVGVLPSFWLVFSSIWAPVRLASDLLKRETSEKAAFLLARFAVLLYPTSIGSAGLKQARLAAEQRRHLL